MISYSNVTEQKLINSSKLVEEQKAQFEIETGILKQAHDIKLAESLSPITKKLTDIKESTQKSGNIMKDSNGGIEKNQEIVSVEIESEDETEDTQSNLKALPNSQKFSSNLMGTVGTLLNTLN